MDNQNVNTNRSYLPACCGAGQAAFWGILLVLLGGFGLLSTVFPLQHLWQYVLPAFLLIWGGYLLVSLRLNRA